jgi:tRNA-binding protein
MLLIYNKQGFADTLLCMFHKRDEAINEMVEVQGDVVILRQNETVIGINIKNASSHFSSLPAGVELSRAPQDAVEQFIKDETGLTDLSTSLAQQFVIGHILEKVKHPDSEKLSVCQVDVGSERLQIVCGAANVAAGQMVVVAKIGSMMPSGRLIEPSVLRKVDSFGMICSAQELNLPAAFIAPGILVLPEEAPIGTDFIAYFKQGMMEK